MISTLSNNFVSKDKEGWKNTKAKKKKHKEIDAEEWPILREANVGIVAIHKNLRRVKGFNFLNLDHTFESKVVNFTTGGHHAVFLLENDKIYAIGNYEGLSN